MAAADRLIAAGIEMASDEGGGISALLTADRVSKRAGLSRRTFYDNFETVEDFAAAVSEVVLSSGDWGALIDPGESVGQAVRSLGRAIRNDPAGRVRLRSCLARNSKGPRADLLTDIVRLLEPRLHEFAFTYGSFREPQDPKSIAETLAVQVLGVALSADMGTVLDGIPSAVNIWLLAATEQLGDHSSMLERIAFLQAEKGLNQGERSLLSQAVNLRRFVVDVTLGLLATQPLSELSLSKVAVGVGVSEALLQRMFSSVWVIADLALSEFLPQILAAPAAEPSSQGDRLSSLVSVLLGLFSTNPGIAEAFLGLQAAGGSPSVVALTDALAAAATGNSTDRALPTPLIANDLLGAMARYAREPEGQDWIQYLVEAIQK